jgi:hypothetical protein
MKLRTRILLSALAFVGTAATCAFLAWMNGYNFDHRDMDVGKGAIYTLMVSGFAFAASMLAAREARK